MRSRSSLRIAVVVLALGAAVVPLPATAIERWYSNGIYPRIQAPLTTFSNVVPWALFDVAAVILAIGVIVTIVGRFRGRRITGAGRALAAAIGDVVVVAASAYLAFLALWGLNYRRVPLEQKVDHVESRVTPESARELGRVSVQQVNALYSGAHSDADRPLEEAFEAAQRRLGAVRFATPGVPKRSLLQLYFRRAAIDGMTNPFFLEVILNRDVLPFEHPFVLAHEWAHLAGYADEAEANLVAWLTCLEGGERARYSGWLAIYGHVMGGMRRADARALSEPLEAGPRADLAAIRARLARATPIVQTAAREAYDAYLRANRVEEGISSYDLVVRLILGAGAENGWAPRARPH
jgi:hypothetical protein